MGQCWGLVVFIVINDIDKGIRSTVLSLRITQSWWSELDQKNRLRHHLIELFKRSADWPMLFNLDTLDFSGDWGWC